MKKLKLFTILAVFGTIIMAHGAEKLFNASRDEVRIYPFDHNTKLTVANNKIDMQLVKDGTGYQGVKILPLKEKFFDF